MKTKTFILTLLFLLLTQWAMAAPVLEIQSDYGVYPLNFPEIEFTGDPAPPAVPPEEIKPPELPYWVEIQADPGMYLFDSEENLYKAGGWAIHQKQWKDARQLFQKQLIDTPKGPFTQRAKFWLAYIDVRLERYKAAQEGMWEVMGKIPQADYLQKTAHALLWLDLAQGNQQAMLDNFQKFSKIIDQPAFVQQSLLLKAVAHQQLEQFDQAAQTYQQWLQRFSDDPQAFFIRFQLANVWFRLGRVNPLLEQINQVYADHATNPLMSQMIWLTLWQTLKHQRWLEAADLLEKLKQAPRSVSILPERAQFHYHLYQQQYDQAFNSILRITQVSLRGYLYREYVRKLHLDQQWKRIETLSLDPLGWDFWSGEGLLVYGQTKERLGKAQEAFDLYQKAEQQAPQPVIQEQARFHRLLWQLRHDQLEKAGEIARDLMKDFPESPRKAHYQFWYGFILAQNQSRHAIIALKQVQKPSDRDDDSINLLGRFYFKQNNLQAAVREFGNLLNQYPQSPFIPAVRFYLATALYQLKAFDQANEQLEPLEKLEKLPVERRVFVVLYVRVLVALQRYEKADKLLADELQKNMDFELVELRLEVLEALRQYEIQIHFLQQALQHQWSEQQVSVLLFFQAEAYRKLNRWEEAIEGFEASLEYANEERAVQSWHALTEINLHLKRYDDFVNYGTRLLDFNPRDERHNQTLRRFISYYDEHPEFQLKEHYLQKLEERYREDLEKVEGVPEKHADLLIKLAEVINQLQRPDEAIELLAKAESYGLEQFRLALWREQGISQHLKGKHAQAVGMMLKSLYLEEGLPVKKQFELFEKVAYSYIALQLPDEVANVIGAMRNTFTQPDLQNAIQILAQAVKQSKQDVSRETESETLHHSDD